MNKLYKLLKYEKLNSNLKKLPIKIFNSFKSLKTKKELLNLKILSSSGISEKESFNQYYSKEFSIDIEYEELLLQIYYKYYKYNEAKDNIDYSINKIVNSDSNTDKLRELQKLRDLEDFHTLKHGVASPIGIDASSKFITLYKYFSIYEGNEILLEEIKNLISSKNVKYFPLIDYIESDSGHQLYSQNHRFQSIQVLEYFVSYKSKDNLYGFTLENSSLFTFINAISQCNIEELQFIDSLNSKLCGVPNDHKFLSTNCSFQQHHDLLVYLNLTGFHSFSKLNFTKICKEFLEINQLEFKKVNLEGFSIFEINEIFTIALKNLDFKFLHLMVNCMDPNYFSVDFPYGLESTPRIIFNKQGEIYQIVGDCITSIIKLMEMFINKFIEILNNNNNNNGNQQKKKKKPFQIHIWYNFKFILSIYQSFGSSSSLNDAQEYYDCIRDDDDDPNDCLDFIIGCGQEGIFKNSFYNIINTLIHWLSNEKFNDLSSTTFLGHFTVINNAVLEFCLNIKRVDLFFEQLDYIQGYIDLANKSYGYRLDRSFPHYSFTYSSPSTTLLPSSSLVIPQQVLERVSHFSENQTAFPKVINSFKYSKQVIRLAGEVLGLESTQSTMDSCRLDIASFLLENYDIQGLNFSLGKYRNNSYCIYREVQYLLENHFDKIQSNLLHKLFNSNSTQSLNDILKTTFPQIKKLFYQTGVNGYEKSEQDFLVFINSTKIKKQRESIEKLELFYNNNIKEITKILDSLFDKSYKQEILPILKKEENRYVDKKNNLFAKHFSRGEIVLCELILKHYPNQFKISNYLIKVH
ncbi:hypothetical protein DDB_G0283997 [Dictyostelium discoideum AX4]|uniref:Uncharacterized protein n=1 Tax=Dictyostelium discoideum TaxID=44689 RepID=Q54QD8_DICDI|nr:hypothetical protein DDB_G0283997 [Dictyostelium discoideum AX4]EAL65486.1 hypothetical protein DDB_G0283997 [Dictyostelium discoideum AX4]|eukprot:XP_638806.1 hypothetical protein DDB_G0283997 [Dictyostelium discoideum AX4]